MIHRLPIGNPGERRTLLDSPSPDRASVHCFGRGSQRYTPRPRSLPSPASQSMGPATIKKTLKMPLPIQAEDVVDSRTCSTSLRNYSTSVTILVGQAEQMFTVHESLLISRSLFFKKALNGPWTEATSRVVRLAGDDAGVFHHYVHLLYTDNIAVSSFRISDVPNGLQGERLVLAKLYVLAEKLQDTKTKRKALSAVYASCQAKAGMQKQSLDINFVQMIYEGTPSGSMARKLTVDHFVDRSTGDPFKASDLATGPTWPAEFMQELLTIVLDKRAPPVDKAASGDVLQYMELDELPH